MGLPSGSSSHFQTLLETALRDYEKQTGTKLAEHPLAHQLETCDSVESVTAVLQRQAPSSNKFRGDDSRAMKSLKRGVHVLYMLSATTLLGEGVGVVRRTEAPLWAFLVHGAHLLRAGFPTREGDICWPCYTTCRTCLPPSIYVSS